MSATQVSLRSTVAKDMRRTAYSAFVCNSRSNFSRKLSLCLSVNLYFRLGFLSVCRLKNIQRLNRPSIESSLGLGRRSRFLLLNLLGEALHSAPSAVGYISGCHKSIRPRPFSEVPSNPLAFPCLSNIRLPQTISPSYVTNSGVK